MREKRERLRMEVERRVRGTTVVMREMGAAETVAVLLQQLEPITRRNDLSVEESSEGHRKASKSHNRTESVPNNRCSPEDPCEAFRLWVDQRRTKLPHIRTSANEQQHHNQQTLEVEECRLHSSYHA